MSTTNHHPILIVGGGTAGITVAAQLRARGVAGIAILEPSEKHYYQPLWTLVGAGVVSKESTERAEADFIPDGVTWIRDAVASFEPEVNALTTLAGAKLTYDQLIVAVGIQLDWHKIDGLPAALGRDGVVSNYRYDLVDSTWRELSAFDGGTAL
ncbi:MAG: FAD-dependent oxidoreductase, partial [Kofleriaceae bacterium]